jgi:SnoaL-like domain
MKTDVSPAIYRLLAGDAINTVLCRYATAIDRCDLIMLKSVYWPDATDDHGIFSGNALEFADFIIPMLSELEHTMHRISNVSIELQGDEAALVQSYYMAYHEHGPKQLLVGGRYLDRFVRRGEEWRIARRVVVMDWNQNLSSTSNWGPGEMYSRLTHGCKAPNDLYYKPK